METVACPYCSSHISNDGRFAGHVVKCPKCAGQFQMPSATDTTQAISYESDVVAISLRKYPALNLIARSSEIGAILAIVSGAIAAVLFAIVWFSTFVTNENTEWLWNFATLFVVEWVIVTVTYTIWLWLKSWAEIIRLMIHVEHNTYTTAELAKRSARRRNRRGSQSCPQAPCS